MADIPVIVAMDKLVFRRIVYILLLPAGAMAGDLADGMKDRIHFFIRHRRMKRHAHPARFCQQVAAFDFVDCR